MSRTSLRARALLAFLALPGMVAFVVPLLLAWPQIRTGPIHLVGLVPLLAGTGLLIWCVRDFLVAGKGTLAPWDPPRQLVSSGPYRWSRNPMYVGVSAILLGWSIVFGSWTLLGYALIVLIAFHLRVVLGEEPWLARTHERRWNEYARRTPRWIFPNRRALFVACGAVAIAIPLAGLIYEAYADARTARDFPAPGMLVDVGGRRLHLLCIGSGETTVLFENSAWGNALSSGSARDRLATRMTVCSYDRRDQGWSDPASGVTTAKALADDLGVLQDRAKLPWPLVIVASSVGGLTAEMFARLYPERVGGLVLVDAATSLFLPHVATRSSTLTTSACSAAVLAHFGLIRLLDPFAIDTDSEEARRSAGMVYGARTWDGVCSLTRGFSATRQEFAAVPPLRADLPVVALSASTSKELMPPAAARFADAEQTRLQLAETHRAFVKQTSRGTWNEVPDSSHLIGTSQPDAVADAVFDVVDLIRKGPPTAAARSAR